MSFKLFVSDYTYRTREDQLAVLHREPELKDAPVYTQDEMQAILRPTTRKMDVTLYASSAGCFAKNEKQLIALADGCRERKICLGSIEEGFEWRPTQSNKGLVEAWRNARKKGSAQIGADRSAKNRKSETERKIEIIRDRWPLPNTNWTTPVLLKEAGLSYNTAKSILGARPIAQYNYQAKLKRKARKNA